MENNPANHELFERLMTPAAYQAAWRYACFLSATREDAEDLLQESLVQALRCIGQLKDISRFRGWLTSIIRTRHMMRRRSEQSGLTAVTGSNEPFGESLVDLRTATGTDPAYGHLSTAIRQLPQCQRELLLLYYIEGYSLVETARVLKISPNAARQRLHRARAALRSLLTVEPGPFQAGLTHEG